MSGETRGEARGAGLDFIRAIIADDVATGKHASIVTRFPPEPNGYLHLGHAKAICLDFGLAQEIPNSRCHLRFDDTNPATEETEYVDGIMADVRWLGFDWKEHLYYASDYFEKLYGFAVDLIRKRKAFVDDQSADEIRANQGSLTEPGRESPFRNRSVEENLDLFARMRAGEFPEGSARAPGPDRHGGRGRRDAGPDPLPDPAQGAPPHGRRLVHLSDVRLRPSAFRCARAGDPLALHPRVPRSPPALRLGDRKLRRAEPTAPDRVRPPERQPHDHEQALPEAPRRRGPRRGLGRSAHADDRGDAASRLPGAGDPGVLRGDRDREARQPDRACESRVPRAPGLEPGGARGGWRSSIRSSS